MSYINKSSRIFIAGHKGLVGSAVYEKFQSNGFNVITADRSNLDLLNQGKVFKFFEEQKFDAVVDAAAKVGGIYANNTYRADFIYQNTTIQNNLLWAAHKTDVSSFIFLGSSCIYPKECPQPIKEEYLLTAPLEVTNRAYALSKISGLELVDCLRRQYQRNYVSLMPCNLYGVNDNFDPENSHVIPALIRRFIEASKQSASKVAVWGSGKPLREFLNNRDLASAVLWISELSGEDVTKMFSPTRSFLNVGSGTEISIRDLAQTIAKIVEFNVDIEFDSSKPDGTYRKLIDSSRFMESGWKPKIVLEEGLREVIAAFSRR